MRIDPVYNKATVWADEYAKEIRAFENLGFTRNEAIEVMKSFELRNLAMVIDDMAKGIVEMMNIPLPLPVDVATDVSVYGEVDISDSSVTVFDGDKEFEE